MKVILVGSGGREHALGIALVKSGASLTSIPGNPGLATIGSIALESELLDKAKSADLVVIGPEQPLVDGLADEIRSLSTPVFGPSKRAAQIEGSKTYMREVALSADIDIARGASFADPEQAKVFAQTLQDGVVVKADGLAAGKGVFVCDNTEDALRRIDEIMVERVFGEAGERVVVEERLRGLETSILVLANGVDSVCLPASQDFKRAFDSDAGLNTGGMGSYSPVDWHPDGFANDVMATIVDPFLTELQRRQTPFVGCLFAGLMVTERGPVLIETNCRFGDPEIQSVLPLVDENVADLLLACATGKLDSRSLRVKPCSAVTVVMASKGYPENYEVGFEIRGLDEAQALDDVIVHHAGTALKDGKVVTNGGRVLSVTAIGASRDAARSRAYEAASLIEFEGAFYRTDIAAPTERMRQNLSS